MTLDILAVLFFFGLLLIFGISASFSRLEREVKQLKYERDKLLKITFDQSDEIKKYRKQLGFDDDKDFRERLDKLMNRA